MAGNTGLRDTSVVKSNISPVAGVMTGVTNLRSWNMRGRIFTGCNHTVMAAFTATNDLCVIHCCSRFPHIGTMTGFTIIAGIDVRCRILAERNRIVVTTDTGAVDLGVINNGYW